MPARAYKNAQGYLFKKHMINFELKSTAIYQALKWEKYFKLVGLLRKFLIFVLIVVLLQGFFSNPINYRLLVAVLSLFVIFWLKGLFFGLKLKNPRLKYRLTGVVEGPEEFNLASFLSFEAARAVKKTLDFCKKRKLSQINSTTLFYFLLSEKDLKLNFIFSRALLSIKEIKKGLGEYLKSLRGEGFEQVFSPEFENTILEAAKIAQKKGNIRIEMGDILAGMSQYDPVFKKILITANLKKEDIENLSWWVENLDRKIRENKKFWEWKNLIKRGSIAKDWAAGFTITLDQFSTDWTEVIKKRGFEDIIGHKRELEQIETILSRGEINNVLLVGEPGSGRLSILHALAMKSLFSLSASQVNAKRVVSLDITSVLSRTTSQEEAEVTLDNIFRETISAGNVILVIDDFHNYIGQEQRPGIIDISGVISPYLPLSSFQIVAVTNYQGLHRNIEPNTSILNLFEKVEVSEISEQETILLLENKVLPLEYKYKKFIPYPALRDIVKYSARYIQNIPFPKKALDLLDEISVYASRYIKSPVIMPDIVSRVISDKTQIPVGEVAKEERETLLNLENLIHQRIINQEEAVNEISAALRRARADITVRKGPMGTFLFLGPTGVGKTETSKALAEVYFGNENRMVRMDMSEFQNISDISRLIGSTEEEGFLTTQVRENPFSLILLDEIEKAHKNILNLFLQVLDEGYLTDGLGRKVSFLNTIIIATSNAGYQIILDALKKEKQMSDIKGELLDYLFKEAIFRPEFVNRFDAVVIFKSLTKENLLQIAGLLLEKLKKNLAVKDIGFIVTDALKEKIVDLGYDPIFGARQMRRVIQDKVENPLATAVLSGELKAGDKVEVDPKSFKLKITQ